MKSFSAAFFLLLVASVIFLVAQDATEESTENAEVAESESTAEDSQSWRDRASALARRAAEETGLDNPDALLQELRDGWDSIDQDAVRERINNLYEEARERGETAGQDMYSWAAGEVEKVFAWEYATLALPLTATPDEIAAALNGMGAERWEAYFVVQTEVETIHLFKRRPRSLLRAMPMRELMWFVNTMGEGGN